MGYGGLMYRGPLLAVVTTSQGFNAWVLEHWGMLAQFARAMTGYDEKDPSLLVEQVRVEDLSALNNPLLGRVVDVVCLPQTLAQNAAVMKAVQARGFGPGGKPLFIINTRTGGVRRPFVKPQA